MSFRVTEVEAVYSPDGWPRPVWLRWEGRTLPVIDVGRRWKSASGIHVLKPHRATHQVCALGQLSQRREIESGHAFGVSTAAPPGDN